MVFRNAEETYSVIGACFNVYNEIGAGFLEAVYQECLELELKDQGIPFESRKPLKLKYKDQTLHQTYIPDFVCYGKIILEIKALSKLCPEHRAQTLNYLKITGISTGLLINFGHQEKLEYERYVV